MAKKTFPPVTMTTFAENNIKFQPVASSKQWKEYKFAPIMYTDEGVGNKLVFVIKQCTLLNFSKATKPSTGAAVDHATITNPALNRKASEFPTSSDSIYIAIDDTHAIALIKRIEEYMCKMAEEKCQMWGFGGDPAVVRASFKESLRAAGNNYTMGLNISPYVAYMKDGVPLRGPIEYVVEQHSLMDIYIQVETLKLHTAFKCGFTVKKICVGGINEDAANFSRILLPYGYNRELLSFSALKEPESPQLKRSNRSAKLLYTEAPVAFSLKNLNGIIFPPFDQSKPGGPAPPPPSGTNIKYTLIVKLTQQNDVDMFTGLNDFILKYIIAHSQELIVKEFSKTSKKSDLYKDPAHIKAIYRNFMYSKDDDNALKQGKPPANGPALFLNIYWDKLAGFGRTLSTPEGETFDVASNMKVPLTIESCDFTCQHIWFSIENNPIITAKFTVTKCVVAPNEFNYGPVAQMDDAAQVAVHTTPKLVPSRLVVEDQYAEAEALEQQYEEEEEEEDAANDDQATGDDDDEEVVIPPAFIITPQPPPPPPQKTQPPHTPKSRAKKY